MEENLETKLVETQIEQYEEEDDLIGLITSNADASGQYVIFRNGFNKLYGINVAKVEELLALGEIELTDNSDTFSLISGVSKVRGNVIPIVNFDRGKLLSAEDSGVIQGVLITVYEQLGLDYELFKDGSLLLERLKELDPDDVSLIITDLEMPVMDGLRLITAIKEDMAYSGIPVVVNTNMANGSVATKCYALGVSHIIPKLDVDELVNAIKTYAR
ncbi:response regulator [Sulfuricurvum sp.]|uniref:response regulator n=1 Tax=Sulfuricurvum sp. TaxID=2025608 RepID=UPI0019A0ACCC|nr:response regulator [Sulfuricurvum sp.]MBD3806620.1 response regulator [Sulfuricurvum sp.]